jgi:hypothetical protein
MKRYMVFAGQDYYPNGGGDDFKGSFEYLVDATDEALRLTDSDGRGWSADDWAHVFDKELDIIVWNHREAE